MGLRLRICGALGALLAKARRNRAPSGNAAPAPPAAAHPAAQRTQRRPLQLGIGVRRGSAEDDARGRILQELLKHTKPTQGDERRNRKRESPPAATPSPAAPANRIGLRLRTEAT